MLIQIKSQLLQSLTFPGSEKENHMTVKKSREREGKARGEERPKAKRKN